MLRYETLFLARTELTDGDTSMIERHFDQVLTDAQGRLDSFDKWGKYKLAYPVNKSNHGIFILARYQVPHENTDKVLVELDQFLKIKCNEIIMRHINVQLKPNAATSYVKPDPMDMSRGGSVDSFFKENKIESLLSSVDSAHAARISDDDDNNNHDEQE